jgi:centrosome and spindle pole-associated protein 1
LIDCPTNRLFTSLTPRHFHPAISTLLGEQEAVARDTELNQRAVDEALSTMNAGTQGIQQLLEKQEGAVSQLVAQMSLKPSRDELAALQDALAKAVSNNECSAEQAEAIYGRYGNMPEDAAGMSRRLDRCHVLFLFFVFLSSPGFCSVSKNVSFPLVSHAGSTASAATGR